MIDIIKTSGGCGQSECVRKRASLKDGGKVDEIEFNGS